LGWQNLIDLRHLKFCNVQYFRCHILSFLCSTKYKVFYVEVLHAGKVQHFLHLCIFFSHQNVVYNFFKY
jgi:hypothetical protein